MIQTARLMALFWPSYAVHELRERKPHRFYLLRTMRDKLELLCPTCKAPVSAGARFCRKCGTNLSATSSGSEMIAGTARSHATIRVSAEETTTDVADGERKTVTALFADIKGSMELMQDLDPEEARAIIDPALGLMIEAVQHYGGYVVQSTGDGIFALFGAPVAHEDHPQRGLYAATRMQDDLRRYGGKLQQEGRAPLEIRVGVNSGEVVVRSIRTGPAQAEYTPIGHTANLAARLQAVARTGSIVVSENTRKLTEGYFQFSSLGGVRVKGIAEPINVHEVTGLGALRTRLQRAVGRGLTRFVGRARELATLKDALELAQARRGQIVATIGEPGVGKSRLYYEFKATSQSGCMELEAYSVSYGKASTYLPVIDLLRNYFDISVGDDERKRREKIAGKIAILDRSLEDTLPYLFSLLGIAEGDDPIAQMDGQLKKRRTQDAIKRILLRESLNQPLIVMFEDLHWIDEQTQEFLNLLADSIATARILLLVNYRPEYSHQWNSKTYYTQLRLDPLGKESAVEMLSALLGDSSELAPLSRLIIDRTDGNPFFMEETVQVLLDEGALIRNGMTRLTKPIGELKIPPTVQAILASRIDRLAPAIKELLQTLAVIGREFPQSLIRAIVPRSDDALSHMLNDLQLGEFIYEQPAVGDAEYIFKHALTQEVAYNSVLIERRKQMHERIGAALEALYRGSLDDHLAELAHHYARSAHSEKAVEYCQRACQQSSDRGSYAEAVMQFETALARLQELPDDVRRAELELDLRNTVHWALRILKGIGGPEGEVSAARALELARRPGISWEKSWIALYGLLLTAFVRANISSASELAIQLLAIAERHANNELTAESLYLLAHLQIFAGHFDRAEEDFDRSISLFEAMPKVTMGLGSRRNRNHSEAYCISALNTWFLGFPNRAVKQMNEAFALARGLNSKFIQEAVHNYALHFFDLLREPERMRDHSAALVASATESGDPFLRAVGEFYLGWFDSAERDRPEIIERMQRALADYRATGSLITMSCMLSLIAQAQARFGRYSEASVTIGETLTFIEETGERHYEAEVHRIKGELLLAQNLSAVSQAEESFRKAIDIARRQNGKSWELRATTSLARLLRDTNRGDEARTMLAEIYNWFTEGFDTADLKDAKALLDELTA
jgi:class 3 adenylate cyclase/tetratricopeptide (TPR) repeat protein